MTNVSVEKLLADLINNESGGQWSSYSPEGIKSLMQRTGNPHLQLPCIHIAGTNGKGSTAHMIDHIFRKAGYRTGLYTSPHLLRYNERIRIDGQEITDDDLLNLLRMIMDLGGKTPGIQLTFFDVMTAAAILHFARNKVEMAVIETGLGGRLDSTSVISSICSIITSISLDHTSILGSTITDIAGEKAGIIRPGHPVIVAGCPESALTVLRNSADASGSPIYIYGNEFTVNKTDDGQLVYNADISGKRIQLPDISVGAVGGVQVCNASLAITASLLLRDRYNRITADICTSALADLVIPGRMEKLNSNPAIMFDPAHNPAAIENLVREVVLEYGEMNPVVIMSVMVDKDSDRMWKILEKYNLPVIYHELNDPRSLKAVEVQRRKYPVRAFTSSIDELASVIRLHEFHAFIFTGSFRLYPVVKKLSQSLSSPE